MQIVLFPNGLVVSKNGNGVDGRRSDDPPAEFSFFGKARSLTHLDSVQGEVQDNDDLDALIFPGGFGVAKNLSDYAMAGAECSINPDVQMLSKEIHNDGKPIGVICIAPAMMAQILGEKTELTIGFDDQTASDINTMGAKHITCSVEEIIIDEDKKVVSTPAYMEANSIKEAAEGIQKLVEQVLKMAK